MALQSVEINEGSDEAVCVIVRPASGSPTSLAVPLTVYLIVVLTFEAGLPLQNKQCESVRP